MDTVDLALGVDSAGYDNPFASSGIVDTAFDMKWDEFINDYELNTSDEFHGPPDGEYLFGKVVHDVRECLNGYRACLQIVETAKSEVPAVVFDCLRKWNIMVEGWLTEINPLIENMGTHSTASLEWAELIAKVGEIVRDTPIFKSELEALSLPSNETLKQVIRIAMRQTAKLDLLRYDVQTQNYKRLWKIRQYSDLISTTSTPNT